MVGIVGEAKVVGLPRAADPSAENVVNLVSEVQEFLRENPCHSACIFLMGRDGVNYFYDCTENRTYTAGALATLQFQLLAGD